MCHLQSLVRKFGEQTSNRLFSLRARDARRFCNQIWRRSNAVYLWSIDVESRRASRRLQGCAADTFDIPVVVVMLVTTIVSYFNVMQISVIPCVGYISFKRRFGSWRDFTTLCWISSAVSKDVPDIQLQNRAVDARCHSVQHPNDTKGVTWT